MVRYANHRPARKMWSGYWGLEETVEDTDPILGETGEDADPILGEDPIQVPIDDLVSNGEDDQSGHSRHER